MTLFLLVLLFIYWLLTYIKGSLFLAKIRAKKPPMVAARESHIIAHILVSSLLPAFALSAALLLPIHIGDYIAIFRHKHQPHSDILHRAFPFFWDPLSWMILIGVGVFFLWVWFPPLLQWWKLNRVIAKLRALPIDSSGYTLPLDLEGIFGGPILLVPGAWCGLVGMFHPTLVLGVELLASLERDELLALLSHEEAHRQRSDPFYRMLILFSSRLLPLVGAQLFERWVERTEELCDQYAAHQLNDPIVVASALVHTRRLQLEHSSQLLNSRVQKEDSIFTGFTQPLKLEDRIQSLLSLENPSAPSPPPTFFHILSSKLALSLLVLQIPLHHTIEYLFFLFK